MPELAREVLDLLARQDRVATRAQLIDLGVREEVVRWNAGRGWQVLLPCTYLFGADAATERQRHVAALLWAGSSSMLAGATAARWHGVTAADPGDRVQVLVPAPQDNRTKGFADVRRSILIDHEPVVRGPVRVCSPARAAVDAAVAARTADTRTAIVIETVQRRLATLDEVAGWMHRLRPRDAVKIAPAVEEAATGAWSLPEAQLLDLVAGSTVLSEPWANPRLESDGLRLTTPDVWFDDVAMAAMVHSRRHHADGDDFDRTVESDADLTAAGVVVVGVTPRSIRRDAGAVLARLERAYRTAAARSRPSVRATPRHLVHGAAWVDAS